MPFFMIAHLYQLLCLASFSNTIDLKAVETFGQQGQLVPSGSIALTSTTTPLSYDKSLIAYEGSLFNLQLELDLQSSLLVFTTKHIAVGGVLSFDSTFNQQHVEDTRQSTLSLSTYKMYTNQIGLGPQIAYYQALTPMVGFFPKAALNYQYFKQQDNTMYVLYSQSFLHLSIDMPFLIHLAPHVFLSIGPRLRQKLYPIRQTATYGKYGLSYGPSFSLGIFIGFGTWF